MGLDERTNERERCSTLLNDGNRKNLLLLLIGCQNGQDLLLILLLLLRYIHVEDLRLIRGIG